MTRKDTHPARVRRERTAHQARFLATVHVIPESARKALAKLGITDPDALAGIGRALTTYRIDQEYTAARLDAQEREGQAQGAAGMIFEVIQRITQLDPEITARMTARRFASHGDGFRQLWNGQALPALLEVHELLTRTVLEMKAATPPPKRGRKVAPANPVYLAALEVIEAHTALGKPAARKAAQEFAAKCGINLAASTSTLQRKSVKNSR